MNPVLALAPRLQRAGGRDGRTTTLLAVTAFAVSTALALSVLGGLLAFIGRAADPANDYQRENGDSYVTLAWIATVLLLVPVVTLAGAAARLGLSRRDARLASLRLLGATPREVVGLTVVETALQGVAGAVVGTVLYGALLPVWAQVPFQGAPPTVGELWVGVPAVLAAWATVPVLAVLSGVVSLRRVVVSPLGVAQRVQRPRLRAARLVLALAGLGVFMVLSAVRGALGAALVAFLLGGLLLAFATMNAVGPWLIGVIGRRQLRRARTPAQLMAARRLLGDPRAVWRVVGGLGLASFVAGCLAVVPAMVGGDVPAQEALLMQDVLTGALLTLAIAFLLAAASAGIAQAGQVLDRRREYALATLAGVPPELFDAARRREVLVPVVAVSVGSALAALLMCLPLVGFAVVAAPAGLVLVVVSLAIGSALVLGATESARPLLRRVLADTVVRAD